MPSYATNTLSSYLEGYFNRCAALGGEIAASATIPVYSAKNLLAYSGKLASAYPSCNYAAWTADAGVAPDGSNTAALLTGDGSNNVHSAQNNNVFPVINGATYTCSVYLKAGTNNYAQLSGGSLTFGITVWANFDLSNGTLGTRGSGCTSAITSVGNGWYRCSVTAAATTTNGYTMSIHLATDSSFGRGANSTLSTSIYAWGAQFELASAATEYISTGANYCLGTPTFGAATTQIVNPRQQLVDFCVGLKAMGIWDTSVFWPLRSHQNVGNGTSALSLGGLGTFDGTLVNGPTWGTDGLTMNGTSQYVEFNNPLATTLGAFTMMSAFCSDKTTGRGLIGGMGSQYAPMLLAGGSPLQGATSSVCYFDLTQDGTGGTAIGTSGRATIAGGNRGVWQTYAGAFSGTALSSQVNAETAYVGTFSATTAFNNVSKWRIGARTSGSYYFSGQQAIGFVSSTYLPAAMQSALYNLYKNTIGVGLPLP